MTTDSRDEVDPPRSERLAWRRPELICYGSIAKLTQSGGATRTESGVPRMRMA